MSLDDQSLDRLIRAAQTDGTDAPASVPSESVIRRYLLGTASPGERHQVREALERSANLRREVLEYAEAVDHAVVSEPLITTAGLEASRLPLPDWVAVQTTVIGGHPAVHEQAAASKSGWSRMWEQLHMPILAPLAIAALLVLLLVARAPQQRQSPGAWVVVTPAVPAEELIAMSTRSNSPGGQPSSGNERDAAVAAFRTALRFDDGEFVYQPTTGLEPTDSSRILLVTLADSVGVDIAKVEMIIPITARINIWILSLPNRTLRKTEYHSGSRTLAWNPEWGRRGCLTCVYERDSKFHATAVQYFEF